MNPSSTHLQVSLRECRLVLERLMHVTRIDPGLVPSLRDCALYSIATAAEGFAALPQHLQDLTAGSPTSVALTDQDGLCVDCQGQHAWLVADALLDLLADEHQRHGSARLLARNIAQPQELRVLQALAERYALRVDIQPQDEGWTLTAHAMTGEHTHLLEHIRREGLGVPRELWWQLFHQANQALAPDSFESRRHAGSIMVDADGRLVGRPDEDETDLSLLMAGLQSGSTAPTH